MKNLKTFFLTLIIISCLKVAKSQQPAIYVTPNSSVGVGTNSPASGFKLDVNGNVKASGFSGDGSQLTNLPGSSVWNSGTNNSINYTAGSIAIGKSTPSSGFKLDVNGNVKASGFSGDGSMLTNLPVSSFWKSGTNNSVYYKGGNIGIGTNIPKATLHVEGDVMLGGTGSALKFQRSNGDVGSLLFLNKTTNFDRGFYKDALILTGFGGGPFQMVSNYKYGTKDIKAGLTINYRGDVGIGISFGDPSIVDANGNPKEIHPIQSKLHVISNRVGDAVRIQNYDENNLTTFGAPDLEFWSGKVYDSANERKVGNIKGVQHGSATTYNGGLAFLANQLGHKSNEVEVMRYNSKGQVSINTITPHSNSKLTVNGSASKTGSSTWAVMSDKRLKKDIKPFNDGLRKVIAINPVTKTS